MYTTDEHYQTVQLKSAEDSIRFTAKRYKESKLRIRELHWWRTIYQAFGEWQTAIDRLEIQMVEWGREEREEHRAMYERYDKKLRELIVASHKTIWDTDDYQTVGRAHAYSEARYDLLFLSKEEVIHALENEVQRTSPWPCGPADKQELHAYVETLKRIIDELKAEGR